MDTEKQLQSLGLSNKETAIYIALLQLGTATVSQIGERAKINRTTVYDLLGELLKRQLVTEVKHGARRMWTAESPDNLKFIPEEQLSIVDNLLPDLMALYNATPDKPRVHYYQGIEGIRFVWEELLNSTSKEYFYIGSTSNITDIASEEYLNDYTRRRIEKGVWSNAIRTDTPDKSTHQILTEQESAFRRLRFFPRKIMGDTALLHLCDNKIAITSTSKEFYGLIIESQELMATLKPMWQFIWDASTSAEY